MCYDWVAAVYDSRIIFSFVIHADIQSQDIRHINSSSHTALVGTDDHHVVAVNLQPFHIGEKSFDKLVSGLYRFKSV